MLRTQAKYVFNKSWNSFKILKNVNFLIGVTIIFMLLLGSQKVYLRLNTLSDIQCLYV
jgi:hypothetical protein